MIMDVGGTVCDPGCVVPLISMKRAFDCLKLPVSYSQIQQFMGRGKTEHIQHLLARVQNKSLTTVNVDTVNQIMNHTVSETCKLLTKFPSFSDLRPSTLKMIDTIRQNGGKCLHTTGYTRQMMEPILWNWRRYNDYVPDGVVCSDDVRMTRPSPDGILKALALHASDSKSLNTHSIDIHDMLSRTIKIDDTEVGVQEGINANVHRSYAVLETGSWMGPFRLCLQSTSDIHSSRVEEYRKLRKLTPYVFPTVADAVNHYISSLV